MTITLRTLSWCLLLHVASSNISDYPCSFRVSSVNHASGSIYNGKYFNFDIHIIDTMLQRANWSGENFNLYNSRTNLISKCIIWRSANGGDDSGHGRKNDGTDSTADFQIGDLMAFADITVNCIMSTTYISPTLYNTDISDYPCSFRVSSVNHAHGDDGKYFNFDIYIIDAMLQRTDWSGQDFTLYNSRTHTISKCIIWRKANGGNDSGHGRKDDYTQSAGDFQIGDFMSFTNVEVNCTAKPQYPANVGDNATADSDDNGKDIAWAIVGVIVFIIIVFLAYKYILKQKKISKEIAVEAQSEMHDENAPKYEDKTHGYATTNTNDPLPVYPPNEAPPPYESTLNDQEGTLQYEHIEGK